MLSTLGEARACADWHAISREYYAGAEPATASIPIIYLSSLVTPAAEFFQGLFTTALGEAEREFWSRSSMTRTASGEASISR